MSTGLMLKKLTLKNILSFGPEGVELELGPLNVLIGPNASGKSNLIDAIRLLAACPKDVTEPIVEGGGFDAWLFKGASNERLLWASAWVDRAPIKDANGELYGDIDSVVGWDGHILHSFGVATFGHRAGLAEESVQVLASDGNYEILYDSEKYLLKTATQHGTLELTSTADLNIVRPKSVFSQVSRPAGNYEMWEVKDFYEDIRVYSDWNTSRSSPIRQTQPADADPESLRADGTNLCLVLNDLDNRPAASRRILEELRDFYPRAQAIKTRTFYGRVEAYIQEEGLRENIPFTRLSDGTLRWLCLLTVLLHPNPPSLICLEEPEMGLHPDMISRLAELMVEASERTQLVVTTHSDFLVSCLSNRPEAIIVCEHLGGSTEFRRINPDHVRKYISDFDLGGAWLKGEIGGTRY